MFEFRSVLNRAARKGRAIGALGVTMVVISPAAAQEPYFVFDETIVRVEEDWLMVLNEPNDSIDSPQFHTVMSPTSDLNGAYAQVLWNYRETPDFTAGGLQLQSYYNDSMNQRRSVEFRQLSTTAESVVWTQALETDGSTLSFEIINGYSTTWGTFGRDMRIDESTEVSDLAGYHVDASVENSCITYGSNRVDKLVVVQVRYYGHEGLLAVDANPRVVYELD